MEVWRVPRSVQVSLINVFFFLLFCYSKVKAMTQPQTLAEAFSQTAKALQQHGIERIRVQGLSSEDTAADASVRVLTEQEFMREFLFRLRPCIILGAMAEWPAMTKWRSDAYLFDLDGHLPPPSEADPSDEDSECEESSPLTSEAPARGGEEDCFPKEPQDGKKRVTVALTPNGYADAVTQVTYTSTDGEKAAQGAEATERIFLSAAEVKLTLPELYQMLKANPGVSATLPSATIDMRAYKEAQWSGAIAYAQLQNNCFNTEYKHLRADVVPNVEKFGTRIFGSEPEASNAWLGTGVSVSSLHQDWVENLYSVVRGVKEFLLIPPWEGIFVPRPEIPSACFELDEAASSSEKLDFRFKPYPVKDNSVMPWMDFDVTPEFVETSDEATIVEALNRNIEACHQRSLAGIPEALRSDLPPKKATTLHPLVAHVHPGETLYLPSMWLHRVSQRADETDITTRAHHRASGSSSEEMPLPLIAAVNYWFDMSFENPAVVMLREFGVLL